MALTFSDAINKVVANPRYNTAALVVSSIEETITANINFLLSNFDGEIVNSIKRLGCQELGTGEQGRPDEIIFEGGLRNNIIVNSMLTYSFKRKVCGMTMLAIVPRVAGVNQGLNDKERENVKLLLREIEFPFKIVTQNNDSHEEWLLNTSFKIHRVEFLSDRNSNMSKSVRAIYVELEEV